MRGHVRQQGHAFDAEQRRMGRGCLRGRPAGGVFLTRQNHGTLGWRFVMFNGGGADMLFAGGVGGWSQRREYRRRIVEIIECDFWKRHGG
jgi:hypothetical protein